MRCSVVITAHNEEKDIARCLKSVFEQQKKPDEVLVVAHNCTDKTVEMAKSFPGVTVDEYSGPLGTVFARKRGFEVAKNDVVAFIDADTVAKQGWLESLIKPLENPAITAVGGYVTSDHLAGKWFGFHFFKLAKLYQPRFKFYFWGANFACRKSDYQKVGGFERLIEEKEKLGLHYWAEDCYLSLALNTIGEVVFAPKAIVISDFVKMGVKGTAKRQFYQKADQKILFNMFGLKTPLF